MAYLFSATSQNWSAAGWKTIDNNGIMISEATNAAPGTTFQSSNSFIPGAITVEGILLKVKYKTTVATPSTTLTVRLYNATAAAVVAGTTVSCYASDLFNNDSAGEGGWVYFKFASPVTLLAASTNYAVQVSASVSASIYVYVSAGTNWARGLVTSTTATPAAGDILYICGDITGVGAASTTTITFDNTSATSYGGLEVGAYGRLIGENAGSKNYLLTLSSGAVFRIGQNGIVELSTTGSRLPTSSTFTLTMTCASAGATFMDVRNYSTFRAYGASKLRDTTLAANLVSGSTTLTTTDATGWLSGDNIGIAGTTGSAGVYARQQQRTLASNASGTTITITTGSGFLTEGTSSGGFDIKADVVNLTSNLVIQGSSPTLAAYTVGRRLSIYDVDNVEYRYMGTTTLAQQAVYLLTNQGSGPVTASFNASGSNLIKDCCFWNSSGNFIYNGNNLNSTIRVDGCVFYYTSTSGNAVTYQSIYPYDTVNTSYLKNSVVIGGARGGFINFTDNLSLDNNVFANCNTTGLEIQAYTRPTTGSVITSTKVYRNATAINMSVTSNGNYINTLLSINGLTSFRNNYGIYLQNIANSTLSNLSLYANLTSNMFIGNVNNCKIISGSIQGGGPTALGIDFNAGAIRGTSGLIFERCNIGTITTHTTADIRADIYPTSLLFNNCNFGSTTLLNNSILITGISKYSFQRFNGTAGSHRVYTGGGYLISDTTIYDTSPSSLRLVPNTTTTNQWNNKLASTFFEAVVNSGSTATISAKIRKSVTADGTEYNGSQPRLILRSNPSAGSAYNNDIVCASGSSAISGSWETLSYTLPAAVEDNVAMEFYVDCDGTTGWVNVDTVVTDTVTNNLTNYVNGEPTIIGTTTSAGSSGYSYTFVS